MIKRLKENEKGLTLIELLVVIVILGIIAAIAIIAIGGIIDNSKKDAHIANAKQIANAAKLYAAAEDMSETSKTAGEELTLKKLIDAGYTDNIKDPSIKNENYLATKTTVTIERTAEGKNSFKYIVELKNKDDKSYIKDTGKTKNVMDLTREDISVDANGK